MYEGFVIGVGAGVLSAFLFGANSVVARVAGNRFDESIMLPTSLFIGMLMSLPVAVAAGKGLTLYSIAAYVFSGIANFSIARYFFFKAIRRIGAGTTTLIIAGNVVLTAILSSLLIGESPSPVVFLGFTFFLGGVAVVSVDSTFQRDWTGIASAFLAMVFVSLVNVSIRYANLGSASPLIGVFVSYASAFLTVLVFRLSLTFKSLRILATRREKSLLLLGMIPFLAQAFRFVSLDYIPAFLAAPILSTSTFFALIILSLTPTAREKVGLRKLLGVAIGFIGILLSAYGA